MSASGQELVAKIASSNNENVSKPGKAVPKNTLLGNGTRLDVSAGCAVNRIQLGKIIYIVLLILPKNIGLNIFVST